MEEQGEGGRRQQPQKSQGDGTDQETDGPAHDANAVSEI